MVQVLVDTEDVFAKPDDFFPEFDVVVVARCTDKELLVKINDICRRNDTLFYAGGVHGMFGYMFADLNQHNFVEWVRLICFGKIYDLNQFFWRNELTVV